MYKWENQILEQYPVEVTETRKGRGVTYCISGTDTYLLKEYKACEQRAAFQREVLQYLNESGLRIPQMLCSKEGESSVADRDGVRYLLMESVTGRECDTRSREDILEAVHTLAKLHRALAAYPGEILPAVCEEKGGRVKKFEKHNRELRHVAKYVQARHGKNAFEQLFLESYSHFLRQGEEIERRARVFYQTCQQPPLGLCHGDYSQHNVLLTRRGAVVMNFEQMYYGEQMSDLGYFMRKILEKQNWNIGLGQEMLHIYQKVLPLSKEKMQQLCYAMGYPEKFWKVVNHYYNRSKSWVSNRNLEKLQRILAQEENRSRFFEQIEA